VISQDGELVGVITEHDLLNWHAKVVDELAKDEASLDPAVYAERVAGETIEDLYNKPAISVDEGADLNAATRILTERRIRRLSVTSNGRLVGIISRADILKGMTQNWERLST
jgi:CBS domain-containing protein